MSACRVTVVYTPGQGWCDDAHHENVQAHYIDEVCLMCVTQWHKLATRSRMICFNTGESLYLAT